MKHFKHRPLFSQAEQNVTPKKKQREWKILPACWAFLKRSAMVLGFFSMFQFLLVILIVLPLLSGAKSKPLPKEMVLYIEFDGAIAEVTEAAGVFDIFDEPSMVFRDVVDTLYTAKDDARVKGIVARMKSAPATLTQAHELRQAINAFEDAGKFTYIYSTSYGEAGGGLASYYLTSTFDNIWMQPMGIVSIPGLHAEMPFMRDTLDKVGITPNFYQRKDFKTAYENFTDNKMSPANRETLTRLIGDIRDEILAVIPAEIDIEPEAFDALVDQGLFTSQEALDAGLVDRVDYIDIMIDEIKASIGKSRSDNEDIFVSFGRYAKDGSTQNISGHDSKDNQDVAVIYAVGAIVSTSGGGSPMGGSNVAAADKIAPAIIRASKDEDVKAIVLRIDSPGGSPSASETILRAVERAQSEGKPVIVSMGGTAASGGYWIAAYADQIFVMPTTITGSIGVVGGKVAFEDLWKKIGVNWEGVSWGENSGLWSINTPFNKSESERINAMLDAIYDAFVARVAKGRDMSEDAVDAIAGGRVWSGKRAVEIGLADQFGSLNDALDYTATIIGKTDRNDLDVYVYPKPKTALENLLDLAEGQALLGQTIRENAAILELAKPITDSALQVTNPHDYMVREPLVIR